MKARWRYYILQNINFQIFFDALCARQIIFRRANIHIWWTLARNPTREKAFGRVIRTLHCRVFVHRSHFPPDVLWNGSLPNCAKRRRGIYNLTIARRVENENHCVRRRGTLVAHAHVNVQTGRALNHQANALRIRQTTRSS